MQKELRQLFDRKFVAKENFGFLNILFSQKIVLKNIEFLLQQNKDYFKDAERDQKMFAKSPQGQEHYEHNQYVEYQGQPTPEVQIEREHFNLRKWYIDFRNKQRSMAFYRYMLQSETPDYPHINALGREMQIMLKVYEYIDADNQITEETSLIMKEFNRISELKEDLYSGDDKKCEVAAKEIERLAYLPPRKLEEFEIVLEDLQEQRQNRF